MANPTPPPSSGGGFAHDTGSLSGPSGQLPVPAPYTANAPLDASLKPLPPAPPPDTASTPPNPPGADPNNNNQVTVQIKIGNSQVPIALDPRLLNPASVTEATAQIQEFGKWAQNQRDAFAQQAFDAGLITSVHAGTKELAVAWALVVQEAALRGQGNFGGGQLTPPSTWDQSGGAKTAGGWTGGTKTDPHDLLAQAAKGGWNSINPTLKVGDTGLGGSGNAKNAPDSAAGITDRTGTTTTSTSYVSFLDPATVQGALADAYYRLMGRNPTTAEYQAFLNSVYTYETEANTGKFDTRTSADVTDKTGGGKTGQPTDINSNAAIQQNIVSQRGLGQRGLQFLAGQSAMANPEEGTYQASTTYFHALMSSLQAPAAGMQASGPTIQAP